MAYEEIGEVSQIFHHNKCVPWLFLL